MIKKEHYEFDSDYKRLMFMEFISRLDSLISKRGLSRNALSKEVKGLNHNSFYAWERRGTIPKGDILLSLADYFQVSVDYLLGKTDNPVPYDKEDPHTNARAMLEAALISLLKRKPTLLEYVKFKEMTENYIKNINKKAKQQI